MHRLRALGWVVILGVMVGLGCGSASDTKSNNPPTKPDPTGTEGGRLPPVKSR